ncbi:hypothetical protein XBI1_810008 [Xenorhabdus bovienii str. Intermedium]|uniref:Uncharacterized protein n=1 Tax=Xenorhabdus bovienii str. Intermedium TaxID=1379677 RepID=A0A077QNW0_XENBV|nr:hypothetical protein XBI1_810008 [Xenorhabdus bovienii str. Intermedium]
MKQREIEYSGQFQRDVKLAQKRHKDMGKLKELMKLINVTITVLRPSLLAIAPHADAESRVRKNPRDH